MSVWILDSGTAGLFDLFGETARAKIALDAQSVRDGQRISRRRIRNRPATPEYRSAKLLEGSAVQFEIFRFCGHPSTLFLPQARVAIKWIARDHPIWYGLDVIPRPSLNPESEVPLYRQLHQHFTELIRTGIL